MIPRFLARTNRWIKLTSVELGAQSRVGGKEKSVLDKVTDKCQISE